MLRKLVLPAFLLLGMNANAADDDFFQSTGLIGIEAGYMGTEYQAYDGTYDVNGNKIMTQESTSSLSLGLKMGAESEFYRAFVEGRWWSTSDYNDAITIGGALQYLIPLNNKMNIFLGVNGGGLNVKSEFDPYAGVDAGMNFDLNDNLGLEVGTRYSHVFIEDDEPEKIDHFYQLYVSVIFKFHNDY